MITISNLKKTFYYLQKNGIIDTYYAVRERFFARKSKLYPDRNYQFVPIDEITKHKQRERVFEKAYLFSILVPMYETRPEFAKAMIESVLGQTYANWELILADSSESDVVEKTVSLYKDERIRYVKLYKNEGISENTNAALRLAKGDYIGLLDHDDLLTPDALFEMASCLQRSARDAEEAAFVYSDEDKCDTDGEIFYEPNIKPDFNFDLLLSNNYICHFTLMKADLMKQLGFRKEYDGAQDYDLVLRAVLYKKPEDVILHVDKVLYHWRCHQDSTAANPRSKQYAYEAGRHAVQDAFGSFLQNMHGADNVVYSEKDVFYVNNIPVRVAHTKHNGFYRIIYGNETAPDIFTVRKDIGIVAGSVKKQHKITGGIKDKHGFCPYRGLPAGFSGYLHRNALQQDCEQADLDNARMRNELNEIIAENIKSNLNLTESNELIFAVAKENNYRILYDPFFHV